MKDEPLHLKPDQIDQLLASLHDSHRSYGALEQLLDEDREALLLDGFRRFLEHFLEERSEGDEAARRLAREYFAADLPFVLLMGGFNHIKSSLIDLVAGNTLEPLAHFREIDAIFEHAKCETARHYLIEEAGRPVALPEAAIRDKTLIRLATEWMDQLRKAIRDDLSQFPLEPAEDSAFAHALRYPESLLICLDLKICDQIMEEHRSIVQQASLLYAMLRAQRHEQAYLAFQEVQRKFTHLLNLLGLLYFESQTNRINRFFGFMQAVLYLPGEKVFCVLNLRQLGKLNALYGNEAGNQALERVEAVLQAVCEAHREWLVYTRGIAGDFYLFGMNRGPDDMAAVLQELGERLPQQLNGMALELGLRHHGIELTGVNELTTENMHLLVEYLNGLAREQGDGIDRGEDAVSAMFDWMRGRYRRILDLREKLTEDATDIFIQPLVTLKRREEIHAFEVLGRFREGDGHISAGLFIDDIIDMGLIVEFDRLILRRLAHQAGELARITRRLFINVSATSLQDPDYLRELATLLEGPLAGFDVVLELTEQTLLEARELVLDLHRRHGLVFAIDDFGTGFSSLQTVIELALEGGVRYLKLDGSLTRSVITHEASERIMRITRQMASELQLETVAEMLETVEQRERVRDIGIDLGQGYLLGVPDPVGVWQGKLNYMESMRSRDREPGFAY